VTNDVPADCRMIGIPATPERDQKLKQAAFSKLPEMRRQLKQLLRAVDQFHDYLGNLLLGPDGSFYGTTQFGGSGGFGTVFKVTTSGVLTVLANFDGFSTGDDPYGGVTLAPDGNLYGTTRDFGPNGGSGTVFRVTRDGALDILYEFSRTTWNGSNYVNSDGAEPYAAVMLAPDGYLYGTTTSGGVNGLGTVFKMTMDGSLTTLFSFGALVSSRIGSTNVNGAEPYGGLTWGPDGNLYGTTFIGGIETCGTAFKMTPNGAFTLLTNFVGTNGDGPKATMTLGPDGCLYGTTVNGGMHGSKGTVFKLTTNGALTTLVSFDTYTGAAPQAGVTFGPDGCLYGTTTSGGTNFNDSWGTVFRVTTNGILTTLADFEVTNGWESEAGVAIGPDGFLYGTTSLGGSTDPNAAGEVFRLNIGLAATNNPPGISIGRGVGGTVILTMTSTQGSTNRLWTATNLSLPLAQWQVLATNVATNGSFEFRDTNASGNPMRFYRSSTP